MTPAISRPARAPRPGLDGIAVLLWVIVSAVALFVYRDSIAALRLLDADDYLRLVQVRDLMAGQSWFDISQHRINPLGGGGLMHWSRFIDMQIAGLIALLTPLLGAVDGERWAITIYPLLLILPLFLILRRILAQLGDRRMAIVGLLIAAGGVTFLHYFVPLRIDHHNWQLLLSVAMLWLALGEATGRKGLLAALLITIHVEISLEGLPYLALFGALFALDWLRDARNAPRLAGFAAGLIFIPIVWLAIFRGPRALLAVHCDSFSLPYLGAVTATGLVLFLWLRGPAKLQADWSRRLAGLGIAAIAGGAAFVALGPTCLGGPFGQLEPLVRLYWYDRVMEGRPIWAQDPDIAMMFAVPTLVGLGAAIWAWRRARGGGRAEDWGRTCFVLLGSAVLSMLVFRTVAAAHAYMTSAFAAMAVALWDRAVARPSVLGRFGGVLLVLLAVPAVDAMIARQVTLNFVVPDRPVQSSNVCFDRQTLGWLAHQKPVLLFAPLDIGPLLLERTPHSVIATGHHRNHAAMDRVITAFLSNPRVAEPIIRGSGATYLLLCSELSETRNLAKANPDGLAADLVRGVPVPWLQRDDVHSRGYFQIYRIKPANQAGLKVSAVPFMQ